MESTSITTIYITLYHFGSLREYIRTWFANYQPSLCLSTKQ